MGGSNLAIRLGSTWRNISLERPKSFRYCAYKSMSSAGLGESSLEAELASLDRLGGVEGGPGLDDLQLVSAEEPGSWEIRLPCVRIYCKVSLRGSSMQCLIQSSSCQRQEGGIGRRDWSISFNTLKSTLLIVVGYPSHLGIQPFPAVYHKHLCHLFRFQTSFTSTSFAFNRSDPDGIVWRYVSHEFEFREDVSRVHIDTGRTHLLFKFRNSVWVVW